MKKKFVLLLAFVFALVLAMPPVTSYAEETQNYVAKINETSYETLKEAIEAGGKITVLKDCILDEQVKISNPVTIQADNTVTITSNMGDVLTVVNGGELTLGANITIESSAAILYANGGTINIDGAKLKCTHEKDALGFVNNGGTINMDSGSLESYWTSLTADGDTTLGATINIFGGTAEVSASNSNTIIVREQGKAVIGDDAILSAVNNATLWAHTGGVLEVNGGTISSENGAVSVETNASATIKNGEFTGSIYTSSNGTITIEDGEFEGSIYANGGTITVQDGEFVNSSTNDKIIYTSNNGKVSVTGGTFAKDPSDYVGDGYFVKEETDSASYKVVQCVAQIGETQYETLAEAIEDGGEITVLKDCTLDAKVTINGEVTITADSTVTITSSIGDVLTVVKGGELTLGANITIESSAAILYANGGTINIDGAKLKCTHEKDALGFVNNGGTINMDSGSLESYWTSLTADGDTTLGATINIFGGTAEVSASNSNTIIVREQGKAVIGDDAILSAVNNATLWAHTGGVLEVNGGTISSENGAVSVETNASATINNGEFKGSIYTSSNGAITIQDGEFEGSIYANGGTITVHSGKFANSSINDKIIYTNNNGKVSVYGGTFTKNPSAYVEIGYEATKEGETWTVAKATPVAPEVVPDTPQGGVDEAIKEEASNAGITEDTIKEALGTVDNSTSLENAVANVETMYTEVEAKGALENVQGYDEDQEVAVEIRPILNVNLTALDTTENTMTLSISATYDVYAVQGEGDNKIDAKLSSESNHLDMAGQEMNIVVPVPTDFPTKNVLVKHKKNGQLIETLIGIVTEGKLSFTTKKGFSDFEVVAADVSHNLTLDSQIDFSFFVKKSDIADNTGLTATIAHKNTVSATWDSYTDTHGEMYGRFRYTGVAAKEMTDDLVLLIQDASGKTVVTDTCSIAEYATNKLNDTNDNNLEELLKALLNYGAAAQTYFNYNTNKMANEGIASPTNVPMLLGEGGTSVFKHNLNLTSEIEFSYFIPKNDYPTLNECTVTINSSSVENLESAYVDGVSYWRIRTGIAPKELGENIVLSATNNSGTVIDNASYTAAEYIANKKNTATTELQTLLDALSLYGSAAVTYFGNN